VTEPAGASPVVGDRGVEGLRRVVEIEPGDRRWLAFVDAHPERLVYHHPAWLQALEQGYGGRMAALACEDGAGALHGLLPCVSRRGLLSGRRLVSLPYTPVAGPLVADESALVALLKRAREKAAGTRGRLLEIRSTAPRLAEFDGGLAQVPWSETYVRELPDRDEELRFGASRNHGRLKWAVNKAQKRGVRVREAESPDDLRAWYRLYLDTLRGHGVPPRPYAFFQAAWDLLRPLGVMRLELAELPGQGGGRLLAGSVFLSYGDTTSYAFNGRRKEDLALRPNDLIQWHALHEAWRAGVRWFDFGEVERGQPGLADFKAKWGAEPRVVFRYYSSPQEEQGSNRGRDVVKRAATHVWRRLPLALTPRVGSWLYRRL